MDNLIGDYKSRYGDRWITDEVIQNVKMINSHNLSYRDIRELWRNHGLHTIERDMATEITMNHYFYRQKSTRELAAISKQLVDNHFSDPAYVKEMLLT